ncbi:alpha/beta hydrolase [Marivita sp.]|uniref:alpha/beta hydrolase n=1 Tax=Marivita sp. TaxID=2003365 RepID=UPI0026249EE6|nr:alpha/beta hydrolase [Marivita sp.]
MRILFIHGRSQGKKSSDILREEWGAALARGLADAGLRLPDGIAFDYPFYGKTLDDFVDQAKLPKVSDIVSMGGSSGDPGFDSFTRSVLQEIESRGEISEEDVRAQMDPGSEITEMGPQNWAWVRAFVRAVDARWPGFSGARINDFLTDVWLYLDKPAVQSAIDAIIEAELTDEPTLVVSHSLGTVVAYNILRKNKINVIGLMTLGSPLAIKAITAKLGLLENVAPRRWVNAYDVADIVALNPLDSTHFPVAPKIANYGGVENTTGNHHGIGGNPPERGYLLDAKILEQMVVFTR